MDFFGGRGGRCLFTFFYFCPYFTHDSFLSNNFKQNNDETHSKQPKTYKKIHTSLWIKKSLKKKMHESKVSRLLPNVCDLQKENHGFKNL
jgi:hypothetical protein